MIRFVVGPDRMVVPDLAARLPGRGMWLSASWDVLHSGGVVKGVRTEREGGALGEVPREGSREIPKEPLEQEHSAADRNRTVPDKVLVRAFSKAARGAVFLPADLPGLLRTGLIQRIAATLGLARRAGQAVAGFEKARDLVKAGRAGLLVQAADGSPAERTRFLSASGVGQASRMPIIDPLPGADLGRVFGRDYVVHVAVAPGRLADSLAVEAGRLAGLTKRSIGTTEQADAPMNEVAGTDE
jgi:ribosomal protein L7Ae-like RNA K-turn-binding protein